MTVPRIRWLRRGMGLAGMAAVLLGRPALAHSPGVLQPGRPFTVKDATISRALYGTFGRGDDVFIVRLHFDEDFALPVELLVPHRDESRKHRPAYAIVGAGLPVPTDEQRQLLPRAVGTGLGSFIDMNRIEPRPAIYESFTRRFFWSSGPVAVVLPRGDYEIWIWSPDRTIGKVVIGFGVEERVDVGDALRDWATYAY